MTTPTPAEDRTSLAENIREIYWRERRQFETRTGGKTVSTGPRSSPRWDGGEDEVGRRYKPIWPKIADHFLHHGLPPAATIRALFDSRIGSAPPLPNALLSDEVLNLAASNSSRKDEEVRHQVAAERNVAASEVARLRRASSWTVAEIYRVVVVTKSLFLTPLFRFCMATQAGQADLAEAYREHAYTQYAEHPEAYEQSLGPDLPAEFRERLGRSRSAARQSHRE